MHTKTYLFHLINIFTLCGSLACSSSPPEQLENTTTSQSQFLSLCGETCVSPLACIDGVCTIPCETDGVCTSLDSRAQCAATREPLQCAAAPIASPCSEQNQQGVCDIPCSDDAECEQLGAGYSCDEGFCRRTNHTPAATEPTCNVPFSHGECSDDKRVYWHNPGTGHCESERSCKVDDNLYFATLTECEATCGSNQLAFCVVNDVIFPHGSNNVPDPKSCRSCSCNDGQIVGCSNEDCPNICREGEGFGTECALCSLEDGCLEERKGCFTTCPESMEGEYCDFGGRCSGGLCLELCED